MSHTIKIVLYSDDTVGVITEDGISLFTPKVACEIAQSLINTAKEADPDLDVEAIMKAYDESHKPISNVTYIN